jgi:hypothetical protein
MKTAHHIYQVFLLVILAFLVSATSTYAASLKFAPSSGNYSEGQSFSVKIDLVLSSGEKVDGTDIYMTFDKDKLKVTQVSEGTLFDSYPVNDFNNTDGKITVSGLSKTTEPLEQSGTVATITFKALATGNAQVRFTLSGDNSTRYTKVVKTVTAENILSTVNSATYTIGAGDSTDEDTVGDDTGGFGGGSEEDTTEDATALPTAGNASPLIMLLVGGVSLVGLGLFSRKVAHNILSR